MKNIDIYTIAKALNETFADNTQYLPVKINFFIQKNKVTLLKLAQEIEDARIKILTAYGESREDGSIFIPEEKIDAVNKELEDLLSIDQEVNIAKIDIEAFPEDINLTTGQMESILFMIN
jgi:hypothetical protein